MAICECHNQGCEQKPAQVLFLEQLIYCTKVIFSQYNPSNKETRAHHAVNNRDKHAKQIVK